MFLYKYQKINDFLAKHPYVSPESLCELSESLFYACQLQGKTHEDIERADTEKKLHEIARVLHVPNYKHKKKHVVKPETINAYNAIFQYTPCVVQVPVPVPEETVEETKQEVKEEEEGVQEQKETENKRKSDEGLEEEEDVLPEPAQTEVVKKRKREEQEKGYVYVFLNHMFSYYGENV